MVVLSASWGSIWFRAQRPQHAEAGEGATTVWQLKAQIEAENAQRERGGRHRLREPASESTSDVQAPGERGEAWSAPPLELQRRVLEGLRRI
ncbi:hypothetical protein [Saccharopolyspora shandongensis]|uniref:hypothetical protein n=1 Tax=Saccharopolyspora shandongensis TaxID=418495 RepID=UPI0033D95C41